MLAEGRRRVALAAAIELVEASAEPSLPFADGEFDALTFTYLLRYVDDPPATLRELARVVRPGGTIAGLEFGVPRGVWRPLWELYVRAGLPGGRSRDRRAAGTRSARSSARRSAATTRRWPLERLLEAWRDAGIDDVRARRLVARRRDRDVGTHEEVRPAFYALRARRLARLRDAPAPAVHAVEPLVRRARRGARAAVPHRPDALDDGGVLARARRRRARARRAERPAAPDADPVRGARRARRRRARRARSRSASGPRWRGAGGCSPSSRSARSLVPAYNLEWFGGASTTTWGLALAWGAFPVLTAYFVEAQTLRAEAVLAAAYATAHDPRPARALDAGAPRPPHARHARGHRADGARAPRCSRGRTVVLAAALVTARLTYEP